MEPNTHSTDGLTALAAVVEQLAAEDRAHLPGTVRADGVLALRQLLDRLEGHWLAEVAAVDADGAPAPKPKPASRPPPPPPGYGPACT